MSVESSQVSDSSRYNRVTEQALTALDSGSAERRRRNSNQIETPRAAEPKRGQGDAAKLSSIVDVFAGGPDEPGRSMWDDGERGSAAGSGDDDAAKPAAGRSKEAPPSGDRPALDLSDDDPFGAEDEKPVKRRKGLSAFLEEKGIDPKKVFDLEVSFGEAEGLEPKTLSELKEVYRESRNFQRERDSFEDYRTGVQNEIIRGRQQMDQTIGLLVRAFGRDVMDDVFKESHSQVQTQAAEGRRQLAEWFPEWDDVQRKAADGAMVVQMLSSYGISKQEFEAVMDPRLVRFAVHAARMMQRYERAKNAWRDEREKKPSKEAPSRVGHRPNVNELSQTLAKRGDKVGAVAALFGG